MAQKYRTHLDKGLLNNSSVKKNPNKLPNFFNFSIANIGLIFVRVLNFDILNNPLSELAFGRLLYTFTRTFHLVTFHPRRGSIKQERKNNNNKKNKIEISIPFNSFCSLVFFLFFSFATCSKIEEKLLVFFCWEKHYWKLPERFLSRAS